MLNEYLTILVYSSCNVLCSSINNARWKWIHTTERKTKHSQLIYSRQNHWSLLVTNIVSEMTYNVSMGTLNPTIPYLPYRVSVDQWRSVGETDYNKTRFNKYWYTMNKNFKRDKNVRNSQVIATAKFQLNWTTLVYNCHWPGSQHSFTIWYVAPYKRKLHVFITYANTAGELLLSSAFVCLSVCVKCNVTDNFEPNDVEGSTLDQGKYLTFWD